MTGSAKFQIKGWCPGALQPMESGDGLIVRVRPPVGCLSSRQLRAIGEGAQRYGNGLVDLTSRANLQIRGVSADSHSNLIALLDKAQLIDPDAATETRRNIVVTPFGHEDDRADAVSIASSLTALLCEGPDLPGKFGFAVDTGSRRVLAEVPADVRIERGRDGQLIVRPDGAERGLRVEKGEAADVAVAVADWFVRSGGVSGGRGRMARHIANTPLPQDLRGDVAPASTTGTPTPGPCPDGLLVAAEFGQLASEALLALAQTGDEIRVTPWRMLLLAEADCAPQALCLITDATDPRLRVTACTGAPGCPQAAAPTRALARFLAPFVSEHRHLHVSGCAKGCARAAPSDVTLCAALDGFALIRDGKASDQPYRSGIAEDEIRANPLTLFETA